MNFPLFTFELIEVIYIKKISLLKLLSLNIAAIVFSCSIAVQSIIQNHNNYEQEKKDAEYIDQITIFDVNSNLPSRLELMDFSQSPIKENPTYLDENQLTYDKQPQVTALADSLLFEKTATEEPEVVNEKQFVNTVSFETRVYSPEEIAQYALRPYVLAQDTDVISYRHENMIDSYCAEIDSSKVTDNDIYLMAKIIHAEICILGDEARRSVGTVIVNRMANPLFPDTVYGVISQPGQFSTCGTRKEPCKKCYSAAYDVLINNYRSFPWYVDSFQCICDGYFSGYKTYVEYNDGQYVTWFSYPEYIEY